VIRNNRHWISLAAILAVEAAIIALLALFAPTRLPALAAASAVPFTAIMWLAVWRFTGPRWHQNISPGDFARAGQGRQEGADEPTPEGLSRSIVERAEEIKRALGDSPSPVRVEMCSLGYRACANDMLTLAHLINGEVPSASPLRRLKLRRCRRRATEALAAANAALPPGALRTMRQEQP